MERTLLEGGLTIIAQCKSQTKDIWQAHFGAAAIAGYFFAQENALSDEAVGSITSQALAMLGKHGYTRTANTPLMKQEDAKEMILLALDESIDQLHWVGHNVIYAALSLLALNELEGWGTKAEIEGITSLLGSFAKSIPGRSWIGYSVSEVKRLELNDKDQFPAIDHASQLSAFILAELSSFRIIYQAEAHHDLIGHMLTYSHALNIMYDLGHVAYFKRGIPPLLKLVKALRVSHDFDQGIMPPQLQLSSPVDRWPLKPAARSEWLPVENEYWNRDFSAHDWDFGHAFKFPFSFYNHVNRLASCEAAAYDNFRCILPTVSLNV
jgi:hypothetical protein